MTDYKETAWDHLQGESYGSFFSGEKKWITKIHKWKDQYPEQVDIRAENEDGSILVHLPIKWLKVSPTKRISDEQKQAMSERGKLNKKNKDI